MVLICKRTEIMKTSKSKSRRFTHGQPVNLSASRALATRFIQDVEADRTYYLKTKIEGISTFFSTRVQELYNSLVATFSLDSLDWSSFKKYIWPVVSSGFALLMGDYLTRGVSMSRHDSEEYDFIYKFYLGAALLSYSAFHRITERRFTSTAALSAAVASEVVAVTYLYSSVFNGTKMLVRDVLSPDYSLLASLGTSTLLVPSGISYMTQKVQEQLVRRQYNKGAQRSDTAVISTGMTPITNFYLQINHFLATELMVSSRLFQLGLISDNILYGATSVQQFRNFPALVADVTPATIKKMRAQQDKLDRDYVYNHTVHQVLRFTPNGPIFVDIPRYQLRRGDLVFCNQSIDLSSVPVSGELVALKRNELGAFVDELEQRKFSVNLRAQNGEDVWIEHLSKPVLNSKYHKIDLHAVRDGKQAGVLVGDKLNLYGNDNLFIQVMPEKELVLSSNYEKTAVINRIISERKQRSVAHSILASLVMALFLQKDLSTIPVVTLKLMFGLFQTMIPFSEAFLRETINSRLMKVLNKNLGDISFETIDALRIVDLCNALGGYYEDRFPNGVAIISDKTGTLTTTKMNVLGLWTTQMPSDVQQVLKEKESLPLPDAELLPELFEVFSSAYTNNKKELEPEEFALLELFQSFFADKECLQVSVHGNNHLKKIVSVKGDKKEMETFHLGLYRTFGGRFTLVDNAGSKYLVFCGIPKQSGFLDTALLHDYSAMQSRTGVLSRDWCIARGKISDEEFLQLQQLFTRDDKPAIEAFITKTGGLLNRLKHYATFIIDNPVKKGAEHFIGQCKEIQVPVFVATGDTTKAAENIARVLCPIYAKNITTIRADQIEEADLEALAEKEFPPESTIIFSGINERILAYFQKLLARDKEKLPVIIFAEMSTEGKGILADFLKAQKFFLVANGDGTNDVLMMKNADMVIAHYSDDASFAPGVGALSNLSDEQLRRLFGSQKSFYELFDISSPHSLFMKLFTPLANSQEKPSLALALKSSKMSFDLVRMLGVSDVKEMYQQHWFSVGFDLMWLWIAFYEISDSCDLPMDSQNISSSDFITKSMGMAMAIAIVQSLMNYALSGESTNLTSMLLMLSFLPLVLRSIFSGFKMVQDRLYPEQEPAVVEELDDAPATTGTFSFARNYIRTLFRPRPTTVPKIELIEEEDNDNATKKHLDLKANA